MAAWSFGPLERHRRGGNGRFGDGVGKSGAPSLDGLPWSNNSSLRFGRFCFLRAVSGDLPAGDWGSVMDVRRLVHKCVLCG